MPKRSNDFQQLIYLINHQLANEAVVTESKFLHDRLTNAEREVDIVIEVQVGNDPIMIGIECQGRGRVATVEWVEQMITKHQSLPTDKLILVSQSGFTATAHKKAEVLGIKTMTLGQAVQDDWNKLVNIDAMKLVKWSVKLSGYIALVTQKDGQTSTIELSFDQQLYDKNEQEMLTVGETVDLLMDMHLVDFGKQMKVPENNEQASYTVFKSEFDVPSGTHFVDLINIKRFVKKLIVIGHYKYEDAELVNMQGVSYGPAQIAFGKTSKVDAKSLVSIVEHENGPYSGAILLPSNNEVPNIIKLRKV